MHNLFGTRTKLQEGADSSILAATDHGTKGENKHFKARNRSEIGGGSICLELDIGILDAKELEPDRGNDFSKHLPNIGLFYSRSKAPSTNDLIQSYKPAGSRTLTEIESARFLLDSLLRLAKDYQVEVFLRYLNRASMPVVPLYEDYLEYVNKRSLKLNGGASMREDQFELALEESHNNTKEMIDLLERKKHRLQALVWNRPDKWPEEILDEFHKKKARAESLNLIPTRPTSPVLPDVTGLGEVEQLEAVRHYEADRMVFEQRWQSFKELEDDMARDHFTDIIDGQLLIIREKLSNQKGLVLLYREKKLALDNSKIKDLSSHEDRANELRNRDLDAVTVFFDTMNVIKGVFKAIMDQFIPEAHSEKIKKLLNSHISSPEYGPITNAYDRGDLNSIIYFLDKFYASSTFRAGWTSIINMIGMTKDSKQSDEEFRTAISRQVDFTIKATGVDSIRLDTLMSIVALQRSSMGSEKFLNNVTVEDNVIGKKSSFQDLVDTLVERIDTFFDQEVMLTKGHSTIKKESSTSNETHSTTTKQYNKAFKSFLADPTYIVGDCISDKKSPGACSKKHNCPFIHKTDPKFLSENNMYCRPFGRVGNCSDVKCKRIHHHPKIVASAQNVASISYGNQPNNPQQSTASKSPIASYVAPIVIHDKSIDNLKEELDVSSFMVLDEHSSVEQSNLAYWDSGSKSHLTGQLIENAKPISAAVRGIGGSIHKITSFGEFAGKTNVMYLKDAPTVFSVNRLTETTDRGKGFCIMGEDGAVLVRGPSVETAIKTLLQVCEANNSIEQRAIVKDGMYIDASYIGENVEHESTQIPAIAPAVPMSKVINTKNISYAVNRIKILGGVDGFIGYLMNCGLKPAVIESLSAEKGTSGLPPEVTHARVCDYFRRNPRHNDAMLATMNMSPLRVPQDYLSLNRTVPGMIMQLDAFSPDFSRNTTGDTQTVKGKKISVNAVIPSIGGYTDCVLIGDVATCGLWIRGRRNKKNPHMILIEFAIRFITRWGSLRYIKCDMEFITKESLEWCSYHNIIIRGSPPGEKFHAMNTGFIEGMVRWIQDGGQFQMNQARHNTELNAIQLIQFWFASCQQAVLLSLLMPSPIHPDISRYAEVYGVPFNVEMSVIMPMATKVIAYTEYTNPQGRGAVFYFMNTSPIVTGAITAISPATGLSSIKYAFKPAVEETLTVLSTEDQAALWPTPIIEKKLYSEEHLYPLFEQFPVTPATGDVPQPIGWETASELVQKVMQKELAAPISADDNQRRYQLRSSARAERRASQAAGEESSNIFLAQDDSSIEEVVVELGSNDELIAEVPEKAFTLVNKKPDIPKEHQRVGDPVWFRAQQREGEVLKKALIGCPENFRPHKSQIILDVKEVAEWKWKPLPDSELSLMQIEAIKAGAARPEGYLACIRWTLRGFKDKRTDLITFAETPEAAFVWWLASYYVSQGLPVITSDIIRAYLNAVEPGDIVVKANRAMQAVGIDKYSIAVLNLYGKKDAARVFQDWLNELLTGTFGWSRMLYAASSYTMSKGKSGEVPTVAVRHSDDFVAFGANAVNGLENIRSTVRMNPIKPIGEFLGCECTRLNHETFEPDEEGRLLMKRCTKKFEKLLQETHDDRLKYNPQRRVRTVALPATYNSYVPEGVKAEPFDITKYKHIIGCLVWPVSQSRADLSYAMHVLATRMSSPLIWDFICLCWFLDYLAVTVNMPLILGGTIVQPTLYMDAAHGSERKNRSCLFWYMTLSPDSGFTEARCSFTQATCISSYEAEVMAAADAIDPLLTLDMRNGELNLPGLGLGFDMIGDNQTEIDWLKDLTVPHRARHIAMRHTLVKESVSDRRVRPDWILGGNNPADLGTKLLTAPLTRKHSAHMLGHRLMRGSKYPFLFLYDEPDSDKK